MKRPFIIGHRGYPVKAIENTILSFQYAFEAGADYVEGDFWLTKDNQIVCIHDDSTYNITERKYNLKITSSILSDLKNLNYTDRKFNQKLNIPTLEEVLEFLPEDNGLFLEIKDNRKLFVDVLKLKLLNRDISPKRLKIISFFAEVLKYSKIVLPEFKTYYLFDWFILNHQCNNIIVFERLLDLLKKINCDGVDVRYSTFINEIFVQKIKNSGLELVVYDVNTLDEIKKISELEVDYLTTDYPDLALKIFKSA